MFALAITTMFGFLALTVDIGLAYTVRKSAQTAADAAALAGAQQAFNAAGWSAFATQTATQVDAGQAASATCPSGVECQASRTCSPSTANPPQTNIDSACLYALNNGFSTASNNGYTQTVSVVASAVNSPGSYATGLAFQAPAPALSAYYWVHVAVTESIPFLFGEFVRKNGVQVPLLTVGVQSVAAIVVTDDGSGTIISTISLVR
jgi:Flp pilus assembly protein TadG